MARRPAAAVTLVLALAACGGRTPLAPAGDPCAGGAACPGDGAATGAGGAAGAGGGTLAPFCTKYSSMREIEQRLIVPGCGVPLMPGQNPSDQPACHNGSFVPELDIVNMVPMNLLSASTRQRLSCKNDPFINREDWRKSFVLICANPALPDGNRAVTCSDGKPGRARMPFFEPPLAADDYECLRRYVYELARNP